MADPSQPSSPHTNGSYEIADGGDHLGHFSNADYDWMGVLDGCFGHAGEGDVHHGHYHDDDYGHAAAAESNGGEALCHPTGAGGDAANRGGHELVPSSTLNVNQSGGGDQTSALIASKHAPADHVPDGCKKLPSSRASSMSPKDNDEEEDAKRSDRVERKRNREKQRRLDTNSQFNTLAALVREIETTDFIEEAQCNSLLEFSQEKTKFEEEGCADAAPEGDSGNKRLKSDTPPDSIFPGGSIQSAISAAGTYSASNRVELIARTSLMLSQFRAIRKKRNEELRDARRQNCEMRKEIEDLRRMVAHYKTLGMGQQKPQDKIMMMVPMMVPHDAVNSISAGFPAVHPCGGPFASQWMPSTSFGHAVPSNSSMPYQQTTQATTTTPPFAHIPVNQNALNTAFPFNMQQAGGQSQGVAALTHQMMQAQAFPFQVPGLSHASNNSTGYTSNSPATSQSNPQQLVQLTTPAQSLAPSSTQGMSQAQAAFHHQNAAMTMMFPHVATGVAPAVGLNPNLQHAPDTSATQHTTTVGAQQPPSSDKPSPSAHSGGGGNLAHCA
ncbi:hypothetical protein HJC23_008770 [Cyclotella cryptica]|uniref:BZIP domain-containing protein n=1 Tax=Cyclotella cryptica TaxID=29204 RepID=A0ABD3PDR9_9STRA|eukprot:CCRYP_015664-RA/>CCRYP_015664-RA protein AED:0.42 eAED:0.67 QI:0/0/0/1/1/1/2/0/553